MKRKVIHISLPNEVYYRLREMAQKDHLPLSTWIKQKILKTLNAATEKG